MRLLGVFLLAFACLAPVSGQEKKAAASTAEDLKQLERDWIEAAKAGDADKLSQYYADDWSGIAFDGKIMTKKAILADVKSGKNKLESIELGPMNVKLLGSVGVVTGSDTEKSTTDGKNSSGKWVWMDVFVKRDGKWQAVRSQSAKLK